MTNKTRQASLLHRASRRPTVRLCLRMTPPLLLLLVASILIAIGILTARPQATWLGLAAWVFTLPYLLLTALTSPDQRD